MTGPLAPQVPAAGQGSALVPFPIEPELKTTQSSGGSTSFGQLSPAQTENLGQQRALTDETVAAAEREKQARVDLARIEEQEAAEIGAIKTEAAARQAQIAEEGEAAFAAAAKRAQEHKEAYESTRIKDFWEDKGTGQRVLAAIAMAMGAAGAALAGGRNYAMEIINGTIDRDYQRQTDNIARLKDRYVTALTGIKDANAARERLKENAGLEAAAKMEAAAAKWAQAKAKAGAPLAEIEADKNILALRQKGLDYEAKALEPTTRRIQRESSRSVAQSQYGASGPKLTGEQATSTAMLGELSDNLNVILSNPDISQKTLRQVQSNADRVAATDKTAQSNLLGSLLAEGARAVKLSPRSKYEGLSPEEQKVAYAWEQVQNGITTILSGKGQTEGEVARAVRRITPQPGDSPQVVAQKKAAALNFIKNAAVTAGPAAPQVGQRLESAVRPSGQAPASPASAGKRIRLKSGETGTLAPDGTFTPD